MTSTLRTLKFAAAAVMLAVLVYSAVLPTTRAQEGGDKGDGGGNEERTHGTGDGDGMGNPCDDHAPGVGGCEEPTATPTPEPTEVPAPTPTPTPTPSALSLPPAPSGFNASAVRSDCTSVVLDWIYRRGIEEYQIQYRGSGGGNWKTKYVSGTRNAEQQRDVDEGRQPRATTTVVSGLKPGTVYSFRIRAEGDGLEYADDYGPWATDAATTGSGCSEPDPPPPPPPTPTKTPTPTPTTPPVLVPPIPAIDLAPAPTGFRVIPNSTDGTRVFAIWNYYGFVDEYEIRYALASAPAGQEDWSYKIIPGERARGLLRATETTIGGLDACTRYQFQIRSYGNGAVYSNLPGKWSKPRKTAKTVGCPTPTPTGTATPTATATPTPAPAPSIEVKKTHPDSDNHANEFWRQKCPGSSDTHWSELVYNVLTRGDEKRIETVRVNWGAMMPQPGPSEGSLNEATYPDLAVSSLSVKFYRGGVSDPVASVGPSRKFKNDLDCTLGPTMTRSKRADIGTEGRVVHVIGFHFTVVPLNGGPQPASLPQTLVHEIDETG